MSSSQTLIELSGTLDNDTVHKTLNKEHILIGRAESNDVIVRDPRVSSLHGQIVFRDGSYIYQDLQSTNGSMVDHHGERFVVDGRSFKERELEDGDLLLLGDSQQPVVLSLRIFEGDGDGPDEDDAASKTILASRAISDFNLLSQQILDDKSLVRSLFRFQKEIHEEEKSQEIYQRTALFLFNHMTNVEYVALHREDGVSGHPWHQVYFSSKAKDISSKLTGGEMLFDESLAQKRAILVDADQLVGLRSAADAARPLRTVCLSPLLHAERVIGFLEVGNTANAQALDGGELDICSVVAYILSARVLNLRLMELVRDAEEKLKNENLFLRRIVQKRDKHDTLIGESKAMQAIRRQIETVGPSELAVLVTGETGTGKELVARSIHDHSKRAGRIFAAVNCGTFTESLLESELFGHMKGAFTGAVETKKGLFEVADGGTLFLDEIGEIPFHLQVKLLRALQEGEVLPVGATTPKKVNVRLVCATNRDLEQEVKENRFREDLYYRINTFPIHLPPLRERGTDVQALAAHFLRVFQSQMNKYGNVFSDECLEGLKRFQFPGNIRQLKNEVQRALLLVDEGEPIEIHHFSPSLVPKTALSSEENIPTEGRTLKELVEEFEVKVIRQVLDENDWNRSKTAQLMGISRQAFMAKLSKYGLSPDS